MITENQNISTVNEAILLLKEINYIKNYNIYNKISNLEIFSIHRETFYHLFRCQELAFYFSQVLMLSGDKKITLIEGCLLHDIGKLTLDPKLLYKKDKLSKDEYLYIKKHTEFKSPILSLDINTLIRLHHKKLCLLRYNNLYEILKIILIIDAYDAMNNKRSYKDKLSYEKIKIEIFNNLNIQFDEEYSTKFLLFLDLFNKEKTLLL
ncbi:TPA: HD domain-containing protein [Clostridioides difficile]|uniref:HD-GYP domain-containing protein n=1 Tax=Clostridioides difficile TaxID=1496 RepID=UPI000BB1CFFB|nr:HD domain-containing protein [Clostridioides difficile]EGT3643707.1 HD domain-containing protein [Clostridioides difficile]MBH7846017.1 HD domain-containing protein [Clostridioides difficile]MBY1346670.1 HD domain-containing protein [Clostridioides difficile]MBY1661404.1 HD domain-containing protein [Clostridioides difficile]MCW0773273.1 HD domain-containing protein [Clostridioides difficile]